MEEVWCILGYGAEILRRFDVTDKNVKEMQNDLSVIGIKVDAYVVSIKHLKL